MTNRWPGRRAGRWVAVLAVLVLVAAGAAAWWFGRDLLGAWFFRANEPTAAAIQEAREGARAIALEPDRVREMVASMHARLNDLAGWGKIRSLDWERFAQEEPDFTRQLDALVSATKDPKLNADFQIARELIRRAAAQRDGKALLYAHRILHDLDCRVFEVHCTDTYWGYTVSLEGPDNPALRYLGAGNPVEAYLRQQGVIKE